jgi:3'(2'), 5'-bisphosphate nucleotidase
MSGTAAGDLSRELAVAVAAAEKAGQAVMSFYKGDFIVDKKLGDEPVTIADRTSESIVIEALRREFPQYGILSEELEDKTSWANFERSWVIDPLDGTKDFVAGRQGFSVMIGLLQHGSPILGVVNQPVAGITYRAAQGSGAWVNAGGTDTALKVSSESSAENARLVASFSHREGVMDRIKETLGTRDEFNIGSVGVKVGLLATGERDLYINPAPHCRLWDGCAPQAILEEAGGKMTDPHGDALAYQPDELHLVKGFVASNGVCHDAVLAKIAPFFS